MVYQVTMWRRNSRINNLPYSEWEVRV